MGVFEGFFNTKIVRHAEQDYHKLRKECISKGVLFEDPAFPATTESLYKNNAPAGLEGISWKRPGDISDNPRLFVDGASSMDVKQGAVGNCWFVASAGDLATRRPLLHHVVPDHSDQEWDENEPEKYCGLFRFRFFEFGEWTDVVIDDRLPVGPDNKLLYVYSAQRNEFWASLLEKAYAKLNGCYENLEGGSAADAMVDFSGGVSENIVLAEQAKLGPERNSLYKALEKAHKRGALISSAITASSNAEMEQQLDTGLVKGHAYAIIDVYKYKEIPLVKLRNPWGEKEWTGPWSDDSSELRALTSKEKKKHNITATEDGEFHMSFDDFCSNFTKLIVCRQVNTSFLSIHKTWRENVVRNRWRGKWAGGCSNYDTYMNNHQYIFTQHTSGPCIVALMQANARAERHLGRTNKTIGFQIMRVEENRNVRLKRAQHVVEKVTYIDSREVVKRFELPQGRYVIMATTFEPNNNGDFMLRLFTEKHTYLRRLKRDTPPKLIGHSLRFRSYPQYLVRITVTGCSRLEKQDNLVRNTDPYVQVKIGRESEKTPVVSDTLSPDFGSSMLFYVKEVNGVQAQLWIYNHNVLHDSFLGFADVQLSEFSAPDKLGEAWSIVRTLKDKNNEGTVSGDIKIQILVSRTLSY